MGPVCRDKHVKGLDDMKDDNDFVDLTLFDPIEQGVILQRDAGGQTYTNIPHLVTHHSPTGFEWGYGGSGPADLALNICEIMLNRLNYEGERVRCYSGDCWDLSFKLHQEFKFRFIATANRDGAVIPYAEIETWVKEQMTERAV